ncbi:hypothetical protein FA15DRAFT_664873 [Coprinopsis marcescibilis]|uniref:Ubiquitin-like-conjugating enzyme ATG10 n=1 Tax=Coprinopsis marcescibilis TaxID=230819 RepID=A0A5C3L725_COPMA|nr:hypothetical protein FA15DRAFT_664873 [Coprinopsis marcescibilis]
MSLDDLMTTSFFKFDAPVGPQSTSFALTLLDTPFPLLSQGDHPTLGTPCWYFHPCETEASVAELVREVAEVDWSEEYRLARWLDLWLMTVGTVVNL